MTVKLSSSQYRILSGFCSDVSKGLVLAAIVGQGVAGELSVVSRILTTLFWVGVALLLLYFALFFSRHE